MSVTFTKLFASITESTVWCESDSTRLAWITMLAMADSRGRVWASVPGLANRARISVEAAREAITTFLSPDPDSRTPDNEGRRIEPIDGGWRLLNHGKYRAIRSSEERREYWREWKAAKRAGEREEQVNDSGDCPPDLSTMSTESAEVTPPAPAPVKSKAIGGHTASLERQPADNPPARALEPGTAACIAMRRLGVEGVNPHHPDLLALVAKGLTAEEAEATAAECIGKGKPRFAYVLAAIRGRREAAREAPEAVAPRVVRSPAGNSPEKPPEPAELAALRFKRDLHRLGRLSDEEMAEAQRDYDAAQRRQA